MLSDEEKKAIEDLKRHIIPFELNDILLNLIEKQSKEIEELKENNKNLKQENSFLEMMYRGTDEFKAIESFAKGGTKQWKK